MSWNTITSADLKRKLSDAEYAAITTASLPSGVTGPDIVSEEIANAITEVCGFIAGNKANLLGTSGTIPDALRDTTLVIIRHRVFTRLPKMKALLDELRVKEYEEAMRKLRDVAAGRFAIVPPETPAADNEQAGGGGVTLVSSSPSRMNRTNLGRLF